MSIRKKSRFRAGMDTSAMSDIMFFLLLFFLIISTLANPNVIKVPLPKANQTDQTANSHLTLSVLNDTINHGLMYYLDQEEVPRDLLEESLRELSIEKGDSTVILRPANDIKVQDLVDILQLGMKNQIKMLIATQQGS